MATICTKTIGRKPSRPDWRTVALLAASATVALGLGCATAEAAIEAPAQRSPQSQTNPPGLANLLRQAKQAMAQGQVGVAVIYLKNAADLAPQNGEVHAELGVILLKTNDYTSAERELRAARRYGVADEKVLPFLLDAMLRRSEFRLLLDQFPVPAQNDRSATASMILRARAAALQGMGQSAQAATSLDQALAINRSAENLAARAQFAYEQGDRSLAEKLADETLSKSPTDFQALVLKISLLQLSGRNDQALTFANRAVKYYPKDPKAIMARVGVYMELNQDAKATADVDKILEDHPNYPVAVYYKAVLKERAHDLQGAWSLAQSLPQQFLSSSPKVGLAVSQMAINAGHMETGTSILSAVVLKFADDTAVRVRLASLYVKIKDYRRALDTLQPLQNSQDPRVLALIGQAYALQNQYAEAAEYFGKAEATGAGGEVLQEQIAAANLKTGNIDAALKGLQTINAKNPGDPKIAGPLVATYLRKGDVAGARNVVNKFVAAAPRNPYGPLFEGQILSATGDLDGAISAFSRSLTLDAKFVPGLYDRAIANAQRGELGSANADIRSILAIDPKNVTALLKSAQIALQLGNAAEAQKQLNAAVAANPKDLSANLTLASFFVSQHRMNDATAALEKYLKVVPQSPNARTLLAEIQLAGGKVDQALGTIKGLQKDYPQSADVETLLGGALAMKKDTKGAMAAYQQAVRLAPTSSSARTTLIRYALATKNDAAALAAAQSYVAQSPGPQADTTLAETYVALKKSGEAIDVLNNSYAAHPSGEVAVNLARLLRQEGQASKADSLLLDWIAKHPTDDVARIEYAQVRMVTNTAAALEQFLAVLKHSPYNVVALNNAAWLMQDKNPQQALIYSERAVKLAPNSASMLDTLASVKLKLKDAAGALPIAQRAHQLNPTDPEISYHLAAALEATGRHAEAKKILEPILAGNQGFDDRSNARELNGKLK